MSDRGQDVSRELTEVRTVLSRAETALRTITVVGTWDRESDPEAAEMEEALLEVVNLLKRWRKTGRPKK